MTECLIKEYHCQHHPGVENTCLLLKKRFYWRGLEKQVEQFIAKCRVCSQCKSGAKPKAPLVIPETTELFEKLAIDIATMVPSSRGYGHILLLVDIFSKMCTAAPLPDETASSVESAIWKSWISYYGIPKELLSDQGSNVDGKVIHNLCSSLGISKIHSSPYHPEGNGNAERYV